MNPLDKIFNDSIIAGLAKQRDNAANDSIEANARVSVLTYQLGEATKEIDRLNGIIAASTAPAAALMPAAPQPADPAPVASA